MEDAPSPGEYTVIDLLLSLTMSLVQVDDPRHPTEPNDTASGFVFAKGEKRYLVTAGHVARKAGPWFWEYAMPQHRGCLLVPAGPFIHYRAATIADGRMSILEGAVPPADFAWTSFDSENLRQRLAEFAGPKTELSVTCYQGPQDTVVVPGTTCVFAAYNRASLTQPYLLREATAQDLVLRSVNQQGHHVFEPVGGHWGHEFYRGASGAPIVNEEGKVVSVLVGGDSIANEIYGQPFPEIAGLAGFDPTTGGVQTAGG